MIRRRSSGFPLKALSLGDLNTWDVKACLMLVSLSYNAHGLSKLELHVLTNLLSFVILGEETRGCQEIQKGRKWSWRWWRGGRWKWRSRRWRIWTTLRRRTRRWRYVWLFSRSSDSMTDRDFPIFLILDEEEEDGEDAEEEGEGELSRNQTRCNSNSEISKISWFESHTASHYVVQSYNIKH